MYTFVAHHCQYPLRTMTIITIIWRKNDPLADPLRNGNDTSNDVRYIIDVNLKNESWDTLCRRIADLVGVTSRRSAMLLPCYQTANMWVYTESRQIICGPPGSILVANLAILHPATPRIWQLMNSKKMTLMLFARISPALFNQNEPMQPVFS